MPQIVIVNVTQTIAPAPNNLQETGALISQGGTNTQPNTLSLLTQPLDLTPLLVAPAAITSLTWVGAATGTIASGTYSGGLVTLTTSAPHTLAPGDEVIVSGATGTGSFAQINGTFVCGSGTTGSTITYTIATGLTMTITGGNFSTGGPVVNVVTASPHGLATGTQFTVTIAGAVPTAYNGNYTATVTGPSEFAYPLASNPGSETTPGTYVPASAAELFSMVTTYFAQGFAASVYVLELGPTTAVQGIAAFQAYLIANPPSAWTSQDPTLYAVVVPRAWDAVSQFIDLIADYESTTSTFYFFVTTTLSTYTSYTDLMKDVIALIEAPSISPTEFTIASIFYVWLGYDPSSVSAVTPFAFSEVAGVTPYPTKGNAALLQTLKNAGINVIGTGAEGGISNTILLWGTTMDGHDATYWYSVDWVQININLDLSNAIINGSNDPQAPLYYDQAGINTLQSVAQATMTRGVQYGLVLPPVNVTAQPFNVYVLANPSDYPEGVYKGLAVSYTPQRGFIQIVFNVNVTEFPLA
jgi:hypothetical protein